MAKASIVRTFTSVLDQKVGEIERPSPPPVGTYQFMVMGLPREDVSTKKGTPYSEFTFKYIQALEDVNEEALEKWLTKGDGERKNLSDQTIKVKFYHNVLWRLEDFLLACEAAEKGMSLEQAIANSPNKDFLGRIVHRASDDNVSMFAEIKTYAKTSSAEVEE